MKRVLARLGSLKLAVILLVLLTLALAAGTIVESTRGAETAGRAVYGAAWFIALQAAFAVNVLSSIAVHFPWGGQRVGFALTHSALLLILAGALASWALKIEGQIEIWEGESGNEIVNRDRQGKVLERARLPFSVQLDSFRIDRYPGTMQPSGFRSDVQVIEAGGVRRKAAIWMNNELEHRGYRLFQSSYRLEKDRSATILSVSKDPGQPIVFAGYALLLAGMCTVLGTRIGQARAKSRRLAAAGAALLGLWAAPASAGIEALPVQHDGRVMPLDTLAREAVWKITGERDWHGAAPAVTVAWWTSDPRAAAHAPFILVGSADLAKAAGFLPGTTHASFVDLVGNATVMRLMEEAKQAQAMERPRRGLHAAAEKVEARLVALQRFLHRDVIRSVPSETKWGVPKQIASPSELAALAGGPRLAGWPEPAAIERELGYNAARPTRLAWIVLTAALVLSLFGWGMASRFLDRLALAGLLAGFGVMTWGIGTRWAIAGRIPAANMYESLLFLAWGVGLFAVIAFVALRSRLVVLNANAMAALTMALTDLLPIDGFIHPMPPVLAGTPWLAIHVPIIMVSYSVLALGVVIAHMQIGFTIFAPRRSELIEKMSDLLYWYVHVGSILLIAGILSGSVWAASSWGRYWGWDPKEVWSLVAFLAYLGILHARWEHLLSPFGVAAMSIVAFQTVLMTYLGVNFVLATGLHSYGMGDSPVVFWMAVVAAAEAAFLGWGWARQRRRQVGPAGHAQGPASADLAVR